MRINYVLLLMFFCLIYVKTPEAEAVHHSKILWFTTEVTKRTTALLTHSKSYSCITTPLRRSLSLSIIKRGSLIDEGLILKREALITKISEKKRGMSSHAQLFDLDGKTALIVGASSGIGERAAYTLATGGAKVILAARRLDKLQAITTDLTKRGFKAFALEMDVTNKASVKQGIEVLEGKGEKIDISVNSAGIFKPTPIFEPDEANDFESIIHTNLLGTWYIVKHISNHMRNNNIEGSIINISSINGANKLRKNMSGYCASKAGVIQLTKACVGELAAKNIRINCILPGLFHTPLTDYKLNTVEAREQIARVIPLGFVAHPGDLDGLILYLASNKASRYVSGAAITIDGGISWGGDSSDLR